MTSSSFDRRKAHPKFTLHTSNMRDRYFRHKASARVRGLSFELSLDEWLRIVTASCVFCGAAPALRHFRRQYGRTRQRDYAAAPFFFNTIDRINITQGYHARNCQGACLLCNRLRSDLDAGTFTNHVRAIVAYLDRGCPLGKSPLRAAQILAGHAEDQQPAGAAFPTCTSSQSPSL